MTEQLTDPIAQLKDQLAAVEKWLAGEYNGIRVGRAAPAILDGVMVEAYGSTLPVNQVASVSIEDAQTLRVNPWDPGMVRAIEKAIEKADLGVSVSVGETGLRVSFPELTHERREQLIKLAKQKLEEARVSVRTARDKVWDSIQQQEKESQVTEDDKYRLKEEMEEVVGGVNKKLEEMEQKKEKEITA